MAQLVKLQDYVSRYEKDIYQYPSRFVRLKNIQWKSMRRDWERYQGRKVLRQELIEEIETGQGPVTLAGRLKLWFFRHKEEEWPDEFAVNEAFLGVNEVAAAETIEDLRRFFLSELFAFQMKWASSTSQETSYVDRKYFYDELLKLLLQGLPDSFLLMYKPVMQLKSAPVELELILLTPTEVWCLTFLEKEDQSVFIGSRDRFWIKRNGEKSSRVLSPLLTISRAEAVLKAVFQQAELDFPIKKAVISRNGFIDYPEAPASLEVIDSRRFLPWFQRLQGTPSPLKTAQLRAAKALLQSTQTTSTIRPEWERHEGSWLYHTIKEEEEE